MIINQRIAVTFFVVLLLTFSCKNDEMVSESQPAIIKNSVQNKFINEADIKATDKALDQFLRTRFNNNSSLSGENITSPFNNYGFAIATEKIMQLSTDAYTTYIFTTYRDIVTLNYTENYVLTIFNDGSYMQLLVNYPLYESEGTLIPDVTSATVTYLDDDLLVSGIETSPCGNTSEEIIGWSDEINCYFLNCTAGGNHSWGEYCEGAPSQQPARICMGGWAVVGCLVYGTGGSSTTTTTPQGGGNATEPTPDTIITPDEIPVLPFVPYWQRVVLCVNNGAVGDIGTTSELPLSDTDIAWMQSKAGAPHAEAIFNFLAENNCTDDTKDFVQQAVEALQDNAEVDFKHRIIIDATLKLKPCHAKVIKATFESTAPVIQLVKAAFNEGTNYTYLLSTNIITPNTINANTSTLPACIESDCTSKTTFNSSYLDVATDLAIAKTAIHESVHAVLGYMYKIGALQTLSTNPDFSELLVAFTTLQAATTQNEINNAGIELNDLQHEFMTELVDDMALALKDYGVSQGYSLPLSYYKKLIWGSSSMVSTPNFQTEFSYFEQQEIIAIAKAEGKGTIETYLINQYDEVTIQPSGTKPNINEPCN